MIKPLPTILLSSFALVACSQAPSAGGETTLNPVTAAMRDANAELMRLRTQGSEKTAREITQLEYPAYRELMKASGLEEALGGEAKTDAALRGLFAGYERKVRSLESELPKMMPMAYAGIEIGYSGLAASVITGDLQTQAAISSWERALGEGRPSGSHSQDGNGSRVDMQWTETGTSMTSAFEGKLPGGLQGKVTTKVEVDTCPDAGGKVKVDFTSNSELRSTTSAGTGGFIKVTARLTKFLDDDAQLIDDQADSEVHVEQTTFDNYDSAFVDVTSTLSTTRGEMGTRVNGRSSAATDASVQAAENLAKMGQMAATQALNAAKQGWESGQCVTLAPTSTPSKRKGAQPSTGFQINAAPRAKSDGAPTGGGVRATLSGGAVLQPGSGKVPADANYAYTGPKEKNESASIAFEARSRRGVGRATLEFDTREGKSYRISGIGDCPGPWDVCDISKPFTFPVCGGSMTHTPTGDTGGNQAFAHSGAQGKGSYTFSGPAEKMTVTYQTTTCAMGRCFATPPGKAIWTRIDSCE
jgi:hypothetical protein